MKSLMYASLAACLPAFAATPIECPNYVRCNCKTHFSQRDQGSQQFLSMVTSTDRRHLYQDTWYADLSVLIGYERNFRKERLSSYFLTQTGTITVGPNNSDATIRASDLGLGADCTGQARLCPHYDNTIIDLDVFAGLDSFVPGLWLQLRIPCVYARANPEVKTNVTRASQYTVYTLDQDLSDTPGIVKAHAGQNTGVVSYINDKNRIDFTGQCAIHDALAGNLPFGDIPVMQGGFIRNQTTSYVGLAGVRLALGYDFFRRERGNAGLACEVIIPAANRPDKDEEFECMPLVAPSVGGQRMWKLGGIARGQYTLAHTAHNSVFQLHIDARMAYCLKTRTIRIISPSPDMCMSQYVLVEKFEPTGDTALYDSTDRLGNLLRADVRLGSSYEGQATIACTYTYGGFNTAIGYNLYGKGAECLNLCHMCTPDFQTYFYVPRGPAPIIAGDWDGTTLTPEYGGGFYNLNETTAGSTGTMVRDSQNSLLPDSTKPVVATNTAQNATTHDISDLALCPAAHPAYRSNTVFASAGYTWNDVQWQPYVTFIGKFEFGAHNSALSMWGGYFKTGAEF